MTWGIVSIGRAASLAPTEEQIEQFRLRQAAASDGTWNGNMAVTVQNADGTRTRIQFSNILDLVAKAQSA